MKALSGPLACVGSPVTAARSRTWSPTAIPVRGADPGVEKTPYGRLAGPKPVFSGSSSQVTSCPFVGLHTRSRGSPAGPRPGVLPVVRRRPGLPEAEGPEGVDHDCELVEVLGAERALHGTRLRPVRVPAGVQRHRPLPDARTLARLVVAVDVEHDLVGVHVGVVVGHRDSERVVVNLPRDEVADDEVLSSKTWCTGGG